MQNFQYYREKEQEELKSQTWPIWLLPKDFEKWFIAEQKRRQNSGDVPLPLPPPDVVTKVLSK